MQSTQHFASLKSYAEQSVSSCWWQLQSLVTIVHGDFYLASWDYDFRKSSIHMNHQQQNCHTKYSLHVPLIQYTIQHHSPAARKINSPQQRAEDSKEVQQFQQMWWWTGAEQSARIQINNRSDSTCAEGNNNQKKQKFSNSSVSHVMWLAGWNESIQGSKHCYTWVTGQRKIHKLSLAFTHCVLLTINLSRWRRLV